MFSAIQKFNHLNGILFLRLGITNFIKRGLHLSLSYAKPLKNQNLRIFLVLSPYFLVSPHKAQHYKLHTLYAKDPTIKNQQNQPHFPPDFHHFSFVLMLL